MRLTKSGSTSISASCTRLTNLSISGTPNRVPTNVVGLNSSKSSSFSPTPINLIDWLVAAQAESAPPPLAVPSNLVTIILPMLVALANSSAC